MEKQSKATVSFWAFDAFDCLVGKVYHEITAEVISRINSFLEAYSLFDMTVVSEGYFTRNQKLFQAIDPNRQIFEVIPSSSLIHSETLTEGITFELSLYDRTVDELMQDSRSWFLEHRPSFRKIDFNDNSNARIAAGADSFYMLRLWQWAACKEIAETSGATILLPNSLCDIERFDSVPFTNDITVKTLAQFKEIFRREVTEIAFFLKDPFVDQLTAIPPVFALYTDLHRVEASPYETIRRLRDEMSDAREMRRNFESGLRQCSSFSEQRELVAQFNADWKRVCDAAFRGPKLFKSEISGGEVAKAAIDAIDLKLSAGTSIIAKIIEHGQARKAHKRFKAYTKLFDKSGQAILGDDFLKSISTKFGVHEFVRKLNQ